MYCVNITICGCQLIGIDYGNEGKKPVVSGVVSRDGGWRSFYDFLSSHRVTMWRGGLSQYLAAVVWRRL